MLPTAPIRSPSGGWIEAAVALDCPVSPVRRPLWRRSTTRTSRGRLVPVLALGERSGKRGDCLPMRSDRNVQIVAGEIQEHPLLG